MPLPSKNFPVDAIHVPLPGLLSLYPLQASRERSLYQSMTEPTRTIIISYYKVISIAHETRRPIWNTQTLGRLKKCLILERKGPTAKDRKRSKGDVASQHLWAACQPCSHHHLQQEQEKIFYLIMSQYLRLIAVHAHCPVRHWELTDPRQVTPSPKPTATRVRWWRFVVLVG